MAVKPPSKTQVLNTIAEQTGLKKQDNGQSSFRLELDPAMPQERYAYGKRSEQLFTVALTSMPGMDRIAAHVAVCM